MDLEKEGRNFEALISANKLVPFKFACRTEYSQSRIYDMIKGKVNLRSLTVAKAMKFASVLGFKSLDEFYKSCGIDLFNE